MRLQSAEQIATRVPEFSGREIALYSRDMLEGLESMAIRHNHRRLAELLHAAAPEAARLASIPEEGSSGK